MIPEWQALARRAVACPRWRWLPGMRWVHTQIPRRGEGPSSARVRDRRPRHGKDVPVTVLPDLTDPATLGCLLALVREAWRCPTVYVRQSTSRRVSDGAFAWEVCDLWLDAEACRALGVDRQGSVGSLGHGSEAEALVAALENGGGGA